MSKISSEWSSVHLAMCNVWQEKKGWDFFCRKFFVPEEVNLSSAAARVTSVKSKNVIRIDGLTQENQQQKSD